MRKTPTNSDRKKHRDRQQEAKDQFFAFVRRLGWRKNPEVDGEFMDDHGRRIFVPVKQNRDGEHVNDYDEGRSRIMRVMKAEAQR